MARKLQIKRGPQANLPRLSEGELGFTTDQKKVYIGHTDGNVELMTINNTLALGETSITAYRGDRGKIAYDHSQATHAPATAQKNSDITKAEIEAKLTGTITTHNHTPQTSVTGNAGTATKLATPRNINGVAFDGSADITVADSTKSPLVHNHNKSQITDFPSSMPASDVFAWAKASVRPTYSASDVGAISVTLKGANNGVAELDSTGKVPSSQLPSYVDDVIEGTRATFPATGETGKIYVDTTTNITWRWSGTTYVEISASLALGTTSSTAFPGDKGLVAYDHSQLTHAPSNAQKNSDITKAEIEAKLTGPVTTHTHNTVNGKTANNTPVTTEKTDLIGMINETFQFANDGRTQIATAINNKGVSATSLETFSSLATKVINNLTKIEGTAIVSEVLTGKTFKNSTGTLLTGTMPNIGAVTQTLTTQGGQYTIPAGYHSGSGKVTANITNLVANNIAKGVNIGGIVGTYEASQSYSTTISLTGAQYQALPSQYSARLYTVSSLPFTPNYIECYSYYTNGSSKGYSTYAKYTSFGGEILHMVVGGWSNASYNSLAQLIADSQSTSYTPRLYTGFVSNGSGISAIGTNSFTFAFAVNYNYPITIVVKAGKL